MIRFIYGFILGMLATVIGAILYLAFAGGDYLLQLSPRYHELASSVSSLKETKEQRDQLAVRLDSLAEGFDQLTRRFNELRESRRGPETTEAPPPAALPPVAHPRPPRAEPTPTPSA